MDYAKNLSVSVAAFFVAACAEEIPCIATGAVKTKNGCECPDGTRLEEDFEAQTSACVADAGVDISPSGAEDSGPTRRDAGSIDAASEDGAAEQFDAEQPDTERGAETAPPEEADAMTPSPDARPACEPTPEECDGQDNDCDGDTDEEVTTRCWVDADGDGFAAMNAEAVESCDECGPKQTSQEPVAGKIDCDDAAPTMSAGTTDICGDGVDNDCDGEIDDEMNNACEGACTASLPGKPGDKCGNGLQGACAREGVYECAPDKTLRCTAPAVMGTDEACDRSDNDCDGTVDEGARNECGMACGATCPPPCTPTAEVCDDKDNDCDGTVDEGARNECGMACGATCPPPCTPTGFEVCDGKDNNCDRQVDNLYWYQDCDNDGYANPDMVKVAGCTQPVSAAGCTWRPPPFIPDCDDTDPERWEIAEGPGIEGRCVGSSGVSDDDFR